MSKTKTIEVTTSDEIRVKAYKNKVIVIVDEPEIDDTLQSISLEDIVTHIRSEGHKPADIFEHEDLSEWAYSNGYVKE